MAIIKKYWFLIALSILLVAGYFSASSLEWLADIEWLKWSVVFVTMFLMAWPISFGQVTATLRDPRPALLASFLNVGVIPLLAWPFAGWAGPELGPGILIAAATPSTLASAAVLTRRAMGNAQVAVMVTILTNASCFLVLPFWIFLQTGNQLDGDLLTQTIYKLLLFVVVPMSLGQLARTHLRSATWATEKRSMLGVIALTGVLSIVFLGAIKFGIRMQTAAPDQPTLSTFQFLYTLGVVASLHVSVFWLGYWTSRMLRFSSGDQIAVAFSGSQKTLMIGLSTSLVLGISIIPIVLFHTSQLLIDAVWAERIRVQQEQKNPVDSTGQ
ncbi:MAG: bile acid:sodium symporter [Planctomycetota bacterium]